MTESDETPEPDEEADWNLEDDPDVLDAVADDPIDLDVGTMLDYRAYLHGGDYQEAAEHYPGSVDFGNGIVFDWDERRFTVDTGYSLGQLADPDATLQVRIDELVERGLDGENAELQARDELLSMDAAFHDQWSDDLVPKVILRIASLEALEAELQPLLAAADARMTRTQVRDYVSLRFVEWFKWSEIHWMDRCEPIRADLPVAWRSPGGSIEVLEEISGWEEAYVAGFFTAEGWQHADFEDLPDEAEEGHR